MEPFRLEVRKRDALYLEHGRVGVCIDFKTAGLVPFRLKVCRREQTQVVSRLALYAISVSTSHTGVRKYLFQACQFGRK